MPGDLGVVDSEADQSSEVFFATERITKFWYADQLTF